MARIRRGWRQQDLAERSWVSRTTVSRVERGHLGEVLLSAVRAIAGSLDIRVEVIARARAVDLDRVINARHSALAEHLVSWLSGFPGWIVRPEVSYSRYGERGVIDLLCWHAASGALLVVEIKTELLEFGELLAKLDAKQRLAPQIARGIGWRPASSSTCLLVADSTTNRRRATAHQGLLRSALPDDGRTLVRWLRQPFGIVRALRFIPDVRPGHARNGFASPTRVRAGSGWRGNRLSRSDPRSWRADEGSEPGRSPGLHG